MSVEETAPHRGTIQLLHFVCVFRARGERTSKQSAVSSSSSSSSALGRRRTVNWCKWRCYRAIVSMW